VAGHALLIDCHSLVVRPVPVPEDVDVVVVDSGERRRLTGSAYAERRSECETAEQTIGPLRLASAADVGRIPDHRIRRRAAHVVSENQRVREAAAALEAGDVRTLGALMVGSHHSLRDDFEVSTPTLDDLVERLLRRPGVHGARLTGAGFGGCVVALAERGSLGEGFIVEPAQGAQVACS
jgi:galactokinase